MDFTPEGNTVVIPLDERVSHRAPALVSLPVRGGDLIIVPPAGQVFVEGEVGKSGLYDLRHRMTLTQLLATAGGLRFPANQKKVTLVREARGEGDETTHWLVDVNRIQSQEQPDVLLEPNDRIVVPARPGRKVVYTVYQAALAVIRISVGGAVALF
jgi:protein involved in polysaccharide export with SLBB domain